MKVEIKRIYDPPAPADGWRVLVDRVWPRGMSKERARIDEWWKEIAPSDGLRRWFGHDPERWPEFRRRYALELEQKGPLIVELLARAKKEKITLLFAARDAERNNAVVLREILQQRKTR